MKTNEIMDILGKTAELTKVQSENAAIMMAELSSQRQLLNGLLNQMNNMSGKVDRLNDRMDVLELQEEIKDEQRMQLLNSAKSRVNEIIGDDYIEQSKYFRGFISRLWSDSKQYGGVGSKIATTRKENYQRAINYIEAWIPHGGVSKLKRELDKKAEEKELLKHWVITNKSKH